jgi:hypothetical protein
MAASSGRAASAGRSTPGAGARGRGRGRGGRGGRGSAAADSDWDGGEPGHEGQGQQALPQPQPQQPPSARGKQYVGVFDGAGLLDISPHLLPQCILGNAEPFHHVDEWRKVRGLARCGLGGS